MLVTMEVDQNVTDEGEIDVATGQRSFLRRNVSSTVAIQSGQSIVMGGLIRENQTHSVEGIPVLFKMPVVGPLFGSTSIDKDRTELLSLADRAMFRVKSRGKGAIGVSPSARAASVA